MKSAVLTGLFIFSIVLNAAVAGTLLWHFWWHTPPAPVEGSIKPLSNQAELEQMRRTLAKEWGRSMMQNQPKFLQKHREILDIIVREPGNPAAADRAIDELVAMHADTERKAVARLSKIISELPEDKRAAFVTYLKDRRCGPMGMGMGAGPKHKHRGRPAPGPPPPPPEGEPGPPLRPPQ
ncbi:MAG: periplasmic heavy metal sensor [Desulfomonile sp.]|nr:periplasmic heavy metal sensor [Desulfomonile sp.]